MTDSPSDPDAREATRNRALLAQIAALLGLPETVFDAPAATKDCETAELLRLWYSLSNGADRRKLLALARNLVTRRG